MDRHVRKVMLKGILGLVAAALIPAVAPGQGSGVASHPMIGEEAPAFVLEEVGGDTLSLDSLKGRYVILHFGASW